jgi:hypothetical protein
VKGVFRVSGVSSQSVWMQLYQSGLLGVTQGVFNSSWLLGEAGCGSLRAWQWLMGTGQQ